MLAEQKELNSLAEKIYKEVYPDVSIDPFTILTIISIIIQIIKLIRSCQDNEQKAFHRMKHPTLFGKRELRRLIKAEFKEKYKEFEISYLGVAQDLSYEDFIKIWKKQV